MSRRIFHCSNSQADKAPSAAGAKIDDEDDDLQVSSDSESEDTQQSTKLSKIKGLSAAQQQRKCCSTGTQTRAWTRT